MAGAPRDNLSGTGQFSDRPFLIGHGFLTIFVRALLSQGRLIVCISAVLVMVLLIIDTHTAYAEMYICSDRSGSMIVTNVPNGSDCKPLKLRKESNSREDMSQGSDSSTRYDGEIRRISFRYNVDPSLIKAIIHTESDFDDRAVSRSGAQGLMQLMPATSIDLRVANPFDPQENIDGGTRYFRSLLDSFDNDLILSLAAYNAGPGLVTRTGGVPRIPETLRYINKVLKRYKSVQGNMAVFRHIK